MKHRVLVILFFLALWSGISAQAVDSDSSRVSFEIDGLGWSTVEGEFSGLTGTVIFDPENLALALMEVCLPVSTVYTDNDKRDNHLKEPDFFDSKKFPEVCFNSTSFSKTGKGYLVKGDLTILGKTQSVEIPFQFKTKGKFQWFEGSLEVNRFDFGLGAEAYDGTFMVGKTAKVTIKCRVEVP